MKLLCSISSHNYLPGTALFASVMAPQLDLTFEEALENFQTRQDLVSLWNQDMIDDGMNIIYSDSSISIIDYLEDDTARTLCRGLYFNENLDLIQTSVPISKETKKVDFMIPLPMESNKHILGFSFALLFHQMNQQSSQQNHDIMMTNVRRSAVLGAGGCSLPILLSLLYPQSTVDAIENNSSIISVAKKYFGIADLDLEGRVKLHQSCAINWVNQKSNEIKLSNSLSYDLLFLDIYETPSQSEDDLDCEAPAEFTLTNDNISHYLTLLSDSGVMAINVLGNDLGTAVALHRIEDGVVEFLASLEDNISMQFAVGIMNLPFQSKELTEEQCEVLPRYNSIVFIVKNPSVWFNELMVRNPETVEKIGKAMGSFDEFRHYSQEIKIKFPFQREVEGERLIVRDWLKTVKFIGIKR
jgi:hypothetical protein